MHLAPLIRDLAVILAVAGLVALVFRRIRQPVVLGYLVAGAVVGPHTPPFPLVTDLPNIRTLAELGVIFLMFSLGLEFSFRRLARVGLSAGFTASFEVLVMLALGFGAGKIAGWRTMDCLFLGAILSISSTTIIIKALDELGLKTRRFAELIFGILIVEDLIAILILAGLTTLAAASGFTALTVASAAAKLALVVGSWFLAGYFVVPRFVHYVGKAGSDEVLLIVSVALCLGLGVFAAHFQYSVALGSFIMGSILAESTESHRIEALVQPLRDVFAAIFFVSVGMLINPASLWEHRWAVLGITIVTIAGKIASTSLGALLTGQTLQTSILVGFGLAQIGEFSFIIATLGLTLGLMSDFLYPVAVTVSLVTTFTTPYLIRASRRISERVEAALPRRARQVLDAYVLWRERRTAAKAPDPAFRRLLLRWLLNGFLVTVIWVLIAEAGAPFLRSTVGLGRWVMPAAWILAVLLSAPFLWAILSTTARGGARRRGDRPSRPAALLVIQAATLAWLAILSLSYFPALYVGIVSLVLGGLFFFRRVYRQLEQSYHWFEEGFTEAFRASPKSEKRRDVLRHFAPWDAHLVRLKVHADSEFSGRTLQETELRSHHGINVVAIQRGSRAIVAPAPLQQLFPKDELLVLGTDDRIDRVRPLIEKSKVTPSRIEDSIAGYELRPLLVSPASALSGRSVRQSGIRERFSAMVVGIERGARRIMNPESDLAFEPDDILWVVGASADLDRLARELA